MHGKDLMFNFKAALNFYESSKTSAGSSQCNSSMARNQGPEVWKEGNI